MSSSPRKMNFTLNWKFWELFEILKIRIEIVFHAKNIWYRPTKLNYKIRIFEIPNGSNLILNFLIDTVPKVGFHKSVALSIITIFEVTSWIFLSLENFLRIRKMLKSAPEQNDKRHLVLLQHLLILEALESSTAHDLGLIGSADFRERANRIVKMTQISILNQLLRKLKSNIWLLNKTRKALPYFNFKIQMVNDDVIQTLYYVRTGDEKVWDSNVHWIERLFSGSIIVAQWDIKSWQWVWLWYLANLQIKTQKYLLGI